VPEPASPPSASAPPSPSTTAPSEIVTRPEPGLARGKWEAPRGAFFVVVGLVVLLAMGALAKKAGIVERLRKKTP
jgi:hypothetical protein